MHCLKNSALGSKIRAGNKPYRHSFLPRRASRRPQGVHVLQGFPVMSNSVQPKAWFEPAAYRRHVADAFSALDREAQKDFVGRLNVLPRHIHSLAQQGLIAVKG